MQIVFKRDTPTNPFLEVAELSGGHKLYRALGELFTSQTEADEYIQRFIAWGKNIQFKSKFSHKKSTQVSPAPWVDAFSLIKEGANLFNEVLEKADIPKTSEG